MNGTPSVLVLLATYNGQPWLQEQIDTLFAQQGCQLRIVACDDASSDQTLNMLQHFTEAHANVEVMHNTLRLGRAGKNFFHLIEHAQLGDAQFVALADQDDHWMPDKLQRALTVLETTSASGYSSDFWAWYPHRGNARELVRKSQAQRQWDHLFQGPGPGCTFVLTRAYFLELREFVVMHRDALERVAYHDWLIYVHARSRQHKWHIDDEAQILYRQHERNEIGVSLGWRAALKRLRMIRSGWLRQQVLCIADITGLGHNWPVQALRRLEWRDRMKLAIKVTDLRRSWRDRLALAIAVLLLMEKEDNP